MPVQFGPACGRSCHRGGGKSSSSSVRVRGPGGFENSSPNSHSQLFFAGVGFSSSSCLGGRATGRGAVRVRVLSSNSRGVETSNLISSSHCLNPSSTRNYFFPGGWGSSSSVRAGHANCKTARSEVQ